MIEFCKKIAIAGLGIEEKLRVSFDDLVRAGEENGSDFAKKVKTGLESIDGSECSIKTGIGKLLNELDVPSKKDFEKLSDELHEIKKNLKDKHETSGT